MIKLASKAPILLMLFLANQAWGQILPFHHYSTEQGLVSNAVTSLCQDSKGYLWIGTGDGVSIFDGTSIRNVTVSEGLALNNVACISESHRTPGTMFIGTWGGGISRLSEGAFTTLLPDSSIDGKTIVDVQEDFEGTLWCATYAGLYRLTNERFVICPDTKDASAVLITRDSLVWIANGRTILICAPGSGEELDRIELPGKGYTGSIHQDRKGAVWIATSDSQLVQVIGRSAMANRNVPFGRVRGIADDAGGNLWLATPGGLLTIALDRAFSSPFIRYSVENGLRSNVIASCLVDLEDNLWAGIVDGGLSRLSDRHFYSFHLPGIPESYNNCRAVTDDRGHVWTFTKGGLVEIWKDQAGQWRSYVHKVAVGSDRSLLCIVRDNAAHLWVDTKLRIECYEIDSALAGPSSLRLRRVLEPGLNLPHGSRFFFIVDSRLNLWISVIGKGVYKVNPWTRSIPAKQYSTANGLPSNDIRAIYEDGKHNIWLGTVAEGLVVIPHDRDSVATRYTTRDGLPDELIRAVVEDKSGKMWIGTRRNGIAIDSSGHFRKVSVEDGLLGSAVWALAPDDTRNLVWAGTSLGVQQVDMTTLLPEKSKHILIGKSVSSLGTYRGQFLWYVTADALSVYEYDSGTVNASPPRMHITRLTVNTRNVNTRSSLEFKHDENLLAFEYVGITFREADAVRYQSRLLGAETDWQPPTTQRTVTYASLAPGSYSFEVRAINADGIMNDTPARLSFTITPPFWVRWWFVGLCVSAFVGIVVLVVRVRVKRLLEIERLRTRIARDLHDEIGSNLSSIAMASDLLGRRPELGEKERGKLSEISSVALTTVKEMKDIVWLIHPGNDSLDDMFLRMKDTAATMLDGCHYTLNFPAMTDGRKVSLEWKRNMYFIYKETLTNIMKHAGATAVNIDVRVEGDHLSLLINDNGGGFDQNSIRSGNGLKNIHERAALLRARLEIDSNVGSGTSVKFETRIT